MGCRGKHAFSHSPNRCIIEEGLASHLGDANEQFGTNEKLSGVVGGGGGVGHGKLN